jgi:hypothetical protein
MSLSARAYWASALNVAAVCASLALICAIVIGFF